MGTRPLLHALCFAIAAAVLGALTACGDGAQTNKAAAPGTQSGQVVLNRGNGAEPASLDPHLVQGNWENNIVGDMLVGPDDRRRQGRADPRRSRKLGNVSRWSDLDLPSARSSMVGWPAGDGGRFCFRLAAHPRSEDRGLLRLLSLSDQERRSREHRQDCRQANSASPRPTTRRWSSRSRIPHPISSST